MSTKEINSNRCLYIFSLFFSCLVFVAINLQSSSIKENISILEKKTCDNSAGEKDGAEDNAWDDETNKENPSFFQSFFITITCFPVILKNKFQIRSGYHKPSSIFFEITSPPPEKYS